MNILVPVAAAALKDKVEEEEEERKQRAVERNRFTSSSTSAAAAEEMMREAGARQSCEATRGVGFCLAGNNIAAQNKGKTKLKWAQEASGAAGGREISQVDSRECALANGTPQDLTRFQTFQGIALYKTCTNRHPLKVCAYAYIASICVCIFQTQVVAWYPKMRILGHKQFRKPRRKIMKTKYRKNHGKDKRMPSLSNFCFAGLSLSVWTY